MCVIYIVIGPSLEPWTSTLIIKREEHAQRTLRQLQLVRINKNFDESYKAPCKLFQTNILTTFDVNETTTNLSEQC